jgi:hypothetical protein
MMRRNIAPQPPVMVGIVVGRSHIALIRRDIRERVAEDFVNCIPGRLGRISH